MSVISNTTVISNFASVGRLDLLQRLFPTLYISVEVLSEIQDGLNEGYTFYRDIERVIHPLSDEGWIQLTGMSGIEELHTYGTLPSRLHPGEASCVAIAIHRKWLFLSDDLAARNQARQKSVRISGTIGCLILAIEQSICEIVDANILLRRMIQQGFYSPVTDLIPLLQK